MDVPRTLDASGRAVDGFDDSFWSHKGIWRKSLVTSNGKISLVDADTP